MQNNVKFVTGSSKVYHLGGNDWYAVMEDDDKVMLVDTDCKIADEKLETPWSDYFRSKDGENGQVILDHVNDIADAYFNDIKYAIEPRNVDAGTYKLENAYMWPMAKEEFEEHKNIGGKIVENSDFIVWTRTFTGSHYAWCVYNSSGDFANGVVGVFTVAPAFYLKKSSIIRINPDGEIILKPADVLTRITHHPMLKSYCSKCVNMLKRWQMLTVLNRS